MGIGVSQALTGDPVVESHFRDSYINATAAAAEVDPSAVTIVELRAGSVVVRPDRRIVPTVGSRGVQRPPARLHKACLSGVLSFRVARGLARIPSRADGLFKVRPGP